MPNSIFVNISAPWPMYDLGTLLDRVTWNLGFLDRMCNKRVINKCSLISAKHSVREPLRSVVNGDKILGG